MDSVIEVLKEMGATNARVIVRDRGSDELHFEFNGSSVAIVAVHCNDSTAALEGFVKERVANHDH